METLLGGQYSCALRVWRCAVYDAVCLCPAVEHRGLQKTLGRLGWCLAVSTQRTRGGCLCQGRVGMCPEIAALLGRSSGEGRGCDTREGGWDGLIR